MNNSHTDLSDQAHAILDRAAADMMALGFEPAAPWRAMSWVGMDALVAGLPADEAIRDLLRLRRMIDVRLTELADGTAQ